MSSELTRPSLSYIPARDARNLPAGSVIARAKLEGLAAGRAPATLWPLHGVALDQGQTPECTVYSGTHWLHCAPNPILIHPTQAEMYHEAQKRDQWIGENYSGSSVLGVCRAFQYFGLITSYYFCNNIAEIADSVLWHQPVMVGMPWYEQMFEPDDLGQVHPGGALAGGHAVTIHGYRDDTRLFRCLNSWGLGWGKWGARFTISWDDLDRLIFRQFGEAAIAVKRGVG